MAGRLNRVVVCAWALFGMPAYGGETLPDPTRPPAAWLARDAAADPAAGGRRLQTVVLPRRGKPVAVIGGQRVALGEAYGEAKVIRITEKEVVLQGPEGREVLELVPEVEKRPAPRAKPAAPAGAARP